MTFGEAAPQKLRQKVLVVGATGLLGREIFKTFSSKVEVRGISTSTPVRIPEVVNGPVLEVFEDQFRNFRPHVVLHLSGSEAFENENSLSFQTFLANTRAIAACCEAHGVWLIHLSSPAVFDGQSAPYTVNAEPNPVTKRLFQRFVCGADQLIHLDNVVTVGEFQYWIVLFCFTMLYFSYFSYFSVF